MYMITMNVNMAIIMVKGKLLLLCRLLVDEECCDDESKYKSKLTIAYGMISSNAIDKNNVPENVIATAITPPSRKQFKPEINFPKMTTSEKNTNMRTILTMVTISIV